MTRKVACRALLALALPLSTLLLSACGLTLPPRPPTPTTNPNPTTPPNPTLQPPGPQVPPAGGFDAVELPSTVTGWAYDANAKERPVEVLVALGENFAPIVTRADQPSQARAGLIGPNHGFKIDVSKQLDTIPAAQRGNVPLLIWAVDVDANGNSVAGSRIPIYSGRANFANGGGGGAERRQVKVEAWSFDPVLTSKGNRQASQVYGWPSPKYFAQELAGGLSKASGGAVEFKIVQAAGMDWPKLIEPVTQRRESWNEKDFILDMENAQAGAVDVRQFDAYDFLKASGIFERLQRKEVDEVWIVGVPFPSTPYVRFGGRGSKRFDALPITEDVVDRPFLMQTFDVRKGMDGAVLDLGRRATLMLDVVFGKANSNDSPWTRFCAIAQDRPGKAGAGMLYRPPNGNAAEDYTNAAFVASLCDSFRLDYPAFTREPRKINRDEWGGTPAGFHRWWLLQLPHRPGRSEGKSNDWWTYITDPSAP